MLRTNCECCATYATRKTKSETTHELQNMETEKDKNITSNRIANNIVKEGKFLEKRRVRRNRPGFFERAHYAY